MTGEPDVSNDELLDRMRAANIWRVRELWARSDISSVECMHSGWYTAWTELRKRGVEIPSELSPEYPEEEPPDFDELSLTPEERAAIEELCTEKTTSERETLFYTVEDYLKKKNGPFADLLDGFAGKLFHTTTDENWVSIRVDGQILPSDGKLEGAYGYRPGDDAGERNLSHNLNGVSLWDFGNPPLKEWLRRGDSWFREFRSITQGEGVILELDRERLPAELVYVTSGCGGRVLFFIEAIHKGPIPVTAVTAVYGFWTSEDGGGPIRVQKLGLGPD